MRGATSRATRAIAGNDQDLEAEASARYGVSGIRYGVRGTRAHTAEASRNQIRTHRPSWDTMSQPAVPAELRLICDRCLSSDPKDRHASAQDLEAELRSYLSTHTPANFAWSRFSPKIRPRLFLIGSLLALITLAALFEAGRRTGLHQGQRSADRARSAGIQPPSASELK